MSNGRKAVAPTADAVYVREYQGQPESEFDWPPPTEYVEHRATAGLAERVRTRFGVTDPNTPVLLTSACETGGHSEFTEEQYFTFTVSCAGHSQDFGQVYEKHGIENGLVQLLDWLDGGTPK